MRAVRLWRQQQRQLLQMCTTSLGTPSEIPLYIAADRIRHVLPLCDSCHTSTLESFSRTTRVTGCLNVKDARQYATSAKFSEGAFVDDNTRGSSTKDLDDQEPDDKQMLLESALSFVKERGWTQASLVAGAQHIGMSPAIIGLLPRGSAELVEYHNEKSNLELTELLQARQCAWQQMRTMQRVREGVKLRLEMNIPYIETWAQALSIQSQPRNVPKALQQLSQVTNDIWHAAGDKSADYNWYTKRGLLASVYTATELYMLTDYSPGYADTWEVLDRRLSNVVKLGKFIGQARQSAASILEKISSSLSA